MPRIYSLAPGLIAGLILLAGCNQNSANNQPPASNAAVANQGLSETPPGSTDVGSNGSGPATGQVSMATQSFAQNVALADMYQVQAGQIAAMRSQSPDVKQFAHQMVDENTQNLNQLKRLVAKDGGADVPTQLDQTHQALLDDLQAANDQQFDPRYIAQQLDQHNQALILMRGYMKSGDMPDFKTFAQQSVPVLTMQQQSINAIDRAHHGHQIASNTGTQPR